MKKMHYHRLVPVLASSVLAMAGLTAGSAWANANADAPAAQTTAETAQGHSHMGKYGKHHRQGHFKRGHKRTHGQRMAVWIPGYGAIGQKTLETLSLDDKQQALLKEAQDSAKALRANRPSRANPSEITRLDPHAAVKQREQAMKEMQAKRAEVTGKWLAFWDGLNAEQQEKVTAVIKERAQKRAERAKRHSQSKAELAASSK